MDMCDSKQKAFAQRVYLDLKICRQWPKLHVYFDERNKWIFFLGTPSNDQPLTFVLPISSDEQLTVDDLFSLKSKLCSSLSSNIGENIQSVLMAIVANDFTLGYFNFTSGLTVPKLSDIPLSLETSSNLTISTLENETNKEIVDKEWATTDIHTTWD